jgi:nitric oxide reductase NorD protein
VDALVRQTLARAPDDPASPLFAEPAASLTWAHEQARAIRTLRGSYRGVATVAHWGRVERAAERQGAERTAQSGPAQVARRRRVAELARTPRVRPATEDRDEQAGAFVVKPNAAQQSVEDPQGMSRPGDRELSPDVEDLAAALAELPEAELVRSEQLAPETLLASELPARAARAPELVEAHAHSYPEWDARSGSYRVPGAIVREPVAALGELSAARAALARHGALIHEVRRRFERLRLRPRRVSRQLDGDDIDLSAYVDAFADRRAGLALDDRLYQGSPRVRRELAVCVLLDASASTDAWINGTQRVIDVEKDALLVVSEALQLIADRHALLAFSGESNRSVDVVKLKSFDERAGEQVQRRITALEPDRYTRLGAALRHATWLLDQQRLRHRLLLLLSDGKPNDVDEYEGSYGVEDARRAVIEARLGGVQPFCLAVDRHAPLYAPRIFGAHGYAVLPRAERLPHALVQVLKQLVAC